MIPEPDGQKRNRPRRGSRSGRPVGFDARDHKGRNVVEWCFNQLKNWRGLATRYDKHAPVFRSVLVLAAILLWLRPTWE